MSWYGDLRDTVRLDLADLGLCIRVLLGGRHLQGRSGGGRREETGSGWYAFGAALALAVILGGLVSLIVMAV